MLSSLKRLVQRATRGTKASASRNRPATLRLEALEARALMSASPVTYVLDSRGELLRESHGVNRVIDTQVQAFKTDARGDVFSLTKSDDLHVLSSSGVLTQKISGVDDIKLNTTGALDLLHTSGELDEWRGGKTTVLARGVKDFGENTTGAVDILYSSGQLNEWHGGRMRELGTNVQSFTEGAHGEVEIEHEGGGGHGRHGND